MNITSGLAPFRGILDMNRINHTQYCSYDTESSKWVTTVSKYGEITSAFATDWYVNLGKYQARVVFSYLGKIEFYVEGYDINTITTTDTEYRGICPYVNLGLDTLGVNGYSYYSSDNSLDRLCMWFEEVKDSYIIVRYDCSNTRYTDSPFFTIEVTVYKDGTILINQSSNTHSHSISVYNHSISSHSEVSVSSTMSGRRSMVLVPDTDNTEVIGWKTTYFNQSNYKPSDLVYTPTYSLAMCQKDPVTGNTIIPKYHGLRDKSDTTVSLGVDEKKLFVGNIKGSNKFLVGSNNTQWGNTMLKFGYGGNAYTITDNSNGGTEFMADFINMGIKEYTRFYTSGNRWWNDWYVYGCEFGHSTRKVIVFYHVINSTTFTEYSLSIPNSSSPDLYLFYKTNNTSTTYGGYGYSGWNKVLLGTIPFTSDCPYGHSGSFVYEFSSPVDIYELTVCPLAISNRYMNDSVEHMILVTNNI